MKMGAQRLIIRLGVQLPWSKTLCFAIVFKILVLLFRSVKKVQQEEKAFYAMHCEA